MGFGKDGKGAILRESSSIDLGTLGAVTAIKADAALVLGDDFRLLKSEMMFTLERDLGGTDEAVLIGICDNELSVAEIAEALSANGPLDRNDNLASERAMRPVWIVAQFRSTAQQNLPNNSLPVIHKGKPWIFSNPEGWTWFAFNPTGSALADTNTPEVKFFGTHYGVWVT